MRNIMALGLDLRGAPLFQPMDEETVARSLIDSLGRNIDRVQDLAKVTTRGVSFRGEMEALPINPGDPRAAGWTFLLNEKDPQRQDLGAPYPAVGRTPQNDRPGETAAFPR